MHQRVGISLVEVYERVGTSEKKGLTWQKDFMGVSSRLRCKTVEKISWFCDSCLKDSAFYLQQ